MLNIVNDTMHCNEKSLNIKIKGFFKCGAKYQNHIKNCAPKV